MKKNGHNEIVGYSDTGQADSTTGSCTFVGGNPANVVAGSSKLNIEMTSTNSVLIWLLVLRNDLGFGLPKA